MTKIVEYSTAFHEKYHQLDCLHFGRNKIVLTYNEYFRFTRVVTWTFPPCIFGNPVYFFCKTSASIWYNEFRAVFYGPPCRKANRRQLAYAKPAAWPREKTGSEDREGRRGK